MSTAPTALPLWPGATEARLAEVIERDGDLEISRIRLAAPLPSDFPPHPRAIEYLSYLRYRRIDGPTDPARADAIMVGHPGGFSGAHALDRVARNTIRAATAHGRTIEWWSIARRGGAAADTLGIDTARLVGDPDLAFDYYYANRPIDGRRFGGFGTHTDLRYVAELGIAQAVQDQHELLVRELPDPEVRRRKVFLGGHSYGNFVTGAYAAWDFDGRPGHRECAGLFGLDLLPVSEIYRLRTLPGLRHLTAPLSSALHGTAVALLRKGLAPRVFPGFAEVLNLVKILALDALHRPDEESDRLRRLPPTPGWEFALRLLFARDYREFLTGTPDPRELRLTGRALFAATVASTHTPISLFQIGIGDFTGGPVRRASFPAPEWSYRIPALRRATTVAFGPGPRLVPADRDRCYDWLTGAPVDLDELAHTLAAGPLGYADQYFPTRILVDGLFWGGAYDGDLSPLQHEDGARRLPRATILADDTNPVLTLLHTGRLVPRAAIRAHHYTHFDVVAAHRPPGGEVVSDALARFVADHTGRRDPRFL